MSLRKSPKADLRSKWQLWVEISTTMSLGILITAFFFFPKLENNDMFVVADPGFIELENIEITTQKVIPPPPPRPVVPVAVPDDEKVADDIPIDITLDVNAKVAEVPKSIEEYEEPINEFPEEYPEPVGGVAAIQSRVVYPDIAKRVGIEGTVIVRAAIDEKGNVMKTVIFKGIGGGCDEAAVKAVEQTKFKPGSQMGKSVKVWMSIPIRFRLR